MKLNYRWSAFWLALGLVAAGGEGIALYENGATDSLSAQIWAVVGLSPFVFYPAMMVFGAGGAWLIYHFFSHRGNK